MTFLMNLAEYLASDIRTATPILLAGLGLLLVNRSGLLNIGCEGIMLVATLFAVAGSYLFQNVWIGLVLAMLSGAAMGLLFAFLTVTMQANQTVIGQAFNLLGAGLSTLLFRAFFGVSTTVTSVPSFSAVNIPLLSDIPFLGTVLFRQMSFVYVAYLIVPLVSFFLFKTNAGLNLRSVGENPRAADTLGVNVYRTRYLASMAGSMLMAAGGAFLSTGLLNFFSDNMVSGRGYIALAAVIFGRYKPSGVMLAALLFAFGNVLANVLQSQNAGIPYNFLVMIPYILTVVALSAFAKKTVAPAATGKPYKKG